MCNNFKSNQNEEIKSEGILIFKDTMEYLVDGILTAEQYAELTRMIYATRWGDGVNEKEIKDKLLLGIWKTLKHTIKKSARNARYRENNQNKKTALQEVTSTEFDLPKIEDYNNGNIQENCQNVENENKADLSRQIVQDNISTHQEQDIQPESLKIALNEEIEDNNINDNEDMGNLTNIVYDSTTGRFQFTNEQKEKVKRNLIKVAASKQISKNEQVQELINNDDELRKYYGRYISTIIAHQEKPTEVTANTKELAKERVRLTLEKYNIDLKEIKDFIDDDIEYHKMLNRYE